MKVLFMLASVVFVLFLWTPPTVDAQRRSTARTIIGTISAFECGDNCYLTIIDDHGKERSGLCSARPLCTKWNADVAMPESYKGKRVRVTVASGTQFDDSGNIAGHTDAFTKIEILTNPTRVSVQPSETQPAALPRDLAGAFMRGGDGIQNFVSQGNDLAENFGAEKMDLNRDGLPEYLIRPSGVAATTYYCGANGQNCSHWLYRKSGNKWNLIFDNSVISVKIAASSTKGYRDLVVFSGWAGHYATETYKFDGRKYREPKAPTRRKRP